MIISYFLVVEGVKLKMSDRDDSKEQMTVTIPPIEEQPQPEGSVHDRMYDPVRDIEALRKAVAKEYEGQIAEQATEEGSAIPKGGRRHPVVGASSGPHPGGSDQPRQERAQISPGLPG